MVADLTPANIAELLEGGRPHPRWHRQLRNPLPHQRLRHLPRHPLDLRRRRRLATACPCPSSPADTACLRCVYPEPPAGRAAHLRNRRRAQHHHHRHRRLWQVSRRAPNPRRQRRRVPRASPRSTLWTGASARSRQPDPHPDCPACALRQFAMARRRTTAPPSASAAATPSRSTTATVPSTSPTWPRASPPSARCAPTSSPCASSSPPYEITVFPDGRAIIKGTTDIALARSLVRQIHRCVKPIPNPPRNFPPTPTTT